MAKKFAMLFGVVFVIVGLLGFVGNPIVGEGALFHTNLAHDVVHLVIGIVLLFVATKKPEQSGRWLKIFGVIYLLLAILGFVMHPAGGNMLGFVEANAADHWLHVILGLVLVLAGMAGKKSTMQAPMQSSPM